MVDVAMLTKQGGRDHNEDYIRKATYEEQLCLILCDGLGGHACGEIASELVAESIAKGFEKQGYYAGFFKDALEQAQRITGRTGAAGSVQLHEDNGSCACNHTGPDTVGAYRGQPVVSDLREWNKISENA